MTKNLKYISNATDGGPTSWPPYKYGTDKAGILFMDVQVQEVDVEQGGNKCLHKRANLMKDPFEVSDSLQTESTSECH